MENPIKELNADQLVRKHVSNVIRELCYRRIAEMYRDEASMARTEHANTMAELDAARKRLRLHTEAEIANDRAHTWRDIHALEEKVEELNISYLSLPETKERYIEQRKAEADIRRNIRKLKASLARISYDHQQNRLLQDAAIRDDIANEQEMHTIRMADARTLRNRRRLTAELCPDSDLPSLYASLVANEQQAIENIKRADRQGREKYEADTEPIDDAEVLAMIAAGADFDFSDDDEDAPIAEEGGAE